MMQVVKCVKFLHRRSALLSEILKQNIVNSQCYTTEGAFFDRSECISGSGQCYIVDDSIIRPELMLMQVEVATITTIPCQVISCEAANCNSTGRPAGSR